MKAIRIVALIALGLSTMGSSCEREEADSGTPTPAVPCSTPSTVAFAQIADWNISSACLAGAIEDVGQSKGYVINSTTDYNASIVCAGLPAVDFGASTLLAGKTRTASGSYVVSQKVDRTCTGYKYTVKLGKGVTTALTDVNYHVLVPKVPSGVKIEFEVQLP